MRGFFISLVMRLISFPVHLHLDVIPAPSLIS